MVFNRFKLIVSGLSVLLGLTSFVFVWSLDKDYLIVGKFLIVLLWLLELHLLIRFVTRTNKSLHTFLESLKSSDFVKNEKMTKSLDDLNLTYNQIIQIVKKARLEQHAQYQYFQYTLEHIPTGVIAFDETGRVEIFNRSAQQLLGIPALIHINELNNLKNGLSEKIMNINVRSENILRLDHQGEQHILIKASRFILLDKNITLLSLQDIKPQLDTKEINAWQKLIRVLTHEIMNSVGPMKSLITTTLSSFKKNNTPKKVGDINDELIDDAILSLETMQERSEGLMSFVTSYKKLIKLPEPRKTEINIEEFLHSIERLFSEEFKQKEIIYSLKNSDDIKTIYADEALLKQVFINIIKNSIEALTYTNEKEIAISAYFMDDRPCIEIRDNGPGMTDEIKEQIFIPFFSTKEEGEGIGLSLSRQIIKAHGGELLVETEVGKGTGFIIYLA